MQKRRTGRTLIIIIFVLCFIALTGAGIFTIINRGSEQLYRALRIQVREHGGSMITLGELMDFDWDQALYFNYTNPHVIYEAIGVNFTGTDLTIGILFVKDEEIVYYEYFPQKTSGLIDLHPIRISMQNIGNGIRIFKRDDVFEVGQAEDYFGGCLYWMRPQE